MSKQFSCTAQVTEDRGKKAEKSENRSAPKTLPRSSSRRSNLVSTVAERAKQEAPRLIYLSGSLRLIIINFFIFFHTSLKHLIWASSSRNFRVIKLICEIFSCFLMICVGHEIRRKSLAARRRLLERLAAVCSLGSLVFINFVANWIGSGCHNFDHDSDLVSRWDCILICL